MTWIVEAFAIIGVLIVGIVIANFLWLLFMAVKGHLMTKLCTSLEEDLTVKYGTWAIVTGCTDGIGRAYSEELARRGLNIVLISRNEEKLVATASDLETKYNVRTKIIVADFSKGRELFGDIEKQLQQIQVGILVNNVGKQYTYPMYLAEVPEEELWDIININIGATMMMTKLVLPQMIARKKGAIVNVSSSSELQPLPLMTVYAATKVFVRSFSEALRVEYQKDGLTVQHLSPFFLNTKMNAFSHRLQSNSLFVPDARTYASNAVRTLGKLKHSTGYWAHGIQYFFTTIPPTWIRTLIGAYMNQIFRRDYLFNNKADVTFL
ncbi:inactive hydroxysteroid dehydrogenase-like protein 1 [Rhodnius prolixus]|uniref:inactive hydroxysteroid dehydrogenase-like protein 1 n=1 Tax=Rhodnius prolixus TaxID=13249 RepID=UPI003D189F3E